MLVLFFQYFACLVTVFCYNISMKALDALNITDSLAASQKGLLTSAQAQTMGIGRMELSRLATNGHLERIMRGVYRASGAPPVREETVWAAWLSMEPATIAYDRTPLDCVVSYNTAAWLMELGELNPEPITFTCSSRRQVASRNIRAVKAALTSAEISTVSGLPCTTASRTVLDLISAGEDLSLVASIVRDALAKGIIPNKDALHIDIDALGTKRGLPRSTSLWHLLLGEC